MTAAALRRRTQYGDGWDVSALPSKPVGEHAVIFHRSAAAKKFRSQKRVSPSTSLCPVVVPGNRAPRSGSSSCWNRMHCRVASLFGRKSNATCTGSVSARHFSLVGCAGPVLGPIIGGRIGIFFLTQGAAFGGRSAVATVGPTRAFE